jgi:hypothetical protein
MPLTESESDSCLRPGLAATNCFNTILPLNIPSLKQRTSAGRRGNVIALNRQRFPLSHSDGGRCYA